MDSMSHHEYRKTRPCRELRRELQNRGAHGLATLHTGRNLLPFFRNVSSLCDPSMPKTTNLRCPASESNSRSRSESFDIEAMDGYDMAYPSMRLAKNED